MGSDSHNSFAMINSLLVDNCLPSIQAPQSGTDILATAIGTTPSPRLHLLNGHMQDSSTEELLLSLQLQQLAVQQQAMQHFQQEVLDIVAEQDVEQDIDHELQRLIQLKAALQLGRASQQTPSASPPLLPGTLGLLSSPQGVQLSGNGWTAAAAAATSAASAAAAGPRSHQHMPRHSIDIGSLQSMGQYGLPGSSSMGMYSSQQAYGQADQLCQAFSAAAGEAVPGPGGLSLSPCPSVTHIGYAAHAPWSLAMLSRPLTPLEAAASGHNNSGLLPLVTPHMQLQQGMLMVDSGCLPRPSLSQELPQLAPAMQPMQQQMQQHAQQVPQHLQSLLYAPAAAPMAGSSAVLAVPAAGPACYASAGMAADPYQHQLNQMIAGGPSHNNQPDLFMAQAMAAASAAEARGGVVSPFASPVASQAGWYNMGCGQAGAANNSSVGGMAQQPRYRRYSLDLQSLRAASSRSRRNSSSSTLAGHHGSDMLPPQSSMQGSTQGGTHGGLFAQQMFSTGSSNSAVNTRRSRRASIDVSASSRGFPGGCPLDVPGPGRRTAFVTAGCGAAPAPPNASSRGGSGSFSGSGRGHVGGMPAPPAHQRDASSSAGSSAVGESLKQLDLDGLNAQSVLNQGGSNGRMANPALSAAPKWAGSFWHPLAEVVKSGQMSSKGTGVFIPGGGLKNAS